MRRALPFRLPRLAHTLRNPGRLVAAALLVAGALSASGGGAQPGPVFAADGWSPPQILSVRMEQPESAYLTFRETNDPGPDGLSYYFYAQAFRDVGDVAQQGVTPAAGNGRVHTVTFTGLLPDVRYCFQGQALTGKLNLSSPTAWDRLWAGPSPDSSGWATQICSDMSQAGTEQSPFPCGVSGIKVTNAVIREYSYTYYCIGSYNFHVSALFDTRPLTTNPADANKHLSFEQMTDGDTRIIANWACATDPWGVGDFSSSCTPRGDPSVQNPKNSFPVTNGPLPLSVRFLDDYNRQQLAKSLLAAVNSPTGTNRPFTALAAPLPSGSPPSSPTPTSVPTDVPLPQLPSIPAGPANFRGMRENGMGSAIILTWDLSFGADYYYLTAASHNGGDPITLGNGDGAPGVVLDGATKQFRVESGDNAANIDGGVDFTIEGCRTHAGCSPVPPVTVQ